MTCHNIGEVIENHGIIISRQLIIGEGASRRELLLSTSTLMSGPSSKPRVVRRFLLLFDRIEGAFMGNSRHHETFPFQRVLDHIFDFSTSSIDLPLSFTKEVGLRLVELLGAQVVLVELAI